jgi:hypothetical protein
VHVGGQVIRSTAEHPFYVEGAGWVACQDLRIGDRLLGADGTTVTVEDLLDTGVYETVYNLRIQDYHTYFVGCDEWGFSVWAHNVDCRLNGNSVQVLKPSRGGTGPNRWQTLVKVPKGADERILHPIPGGAQQGREYTWHDAAGKKWTVRFHDADPGAGAGSNSASGWTVRILRGKQSLDSSGTFHPPGIFNSLSPFYSPATINNVHIPVNQPAKWPII